jgi:hypothetical protein
VPGIVGSVCERFSGISAQAHRAHDKFGTLQCGLQNFRDPRFVFNDQKTHVFALFAEQRREEAVSPGPLAAAHFRRAQPV